MLRLHPFRAIRPHEAKAEEVASVPYDVVNRQEARALAEGHVNNFLHVVRSEIDLPDEVGPYDAVVYERARENFTRMMKESVLIQEEGESLYLYRQIMGEQSQVGLVGCCHIDDYETNIIKKHEHTRKVKEDDRTRHVLAINANSGPVFLTYRQDAAVDGLVDEEMKNAPVLYDFTSPDGVRHTVWRVVNPSAFVDAFGGVEAAYVADGHHRSASAWRAGQEKRKANPNHGGDEEYNWFLSVLFPDNQLNILPYNRVVKDLNGQSPAEVIKKLQSVGTFERTENPEPGHTGSFCFYLAESGWYCLTLDSALIDSADPIASLDVALLHDRVLGPIFNIGDPRTDDRVDFVGGIRGTKELESRVDSGEWACGVSMFPTTIEQLLRVADADRVMPPKSTWFEPKLRSGLFSHLLD